MNMVRYVWEWLMSVDPRGRRGRRRFTTELVALVAAAFLLGAWACPVRAQEDETPRSDALRRAAENLRHGIIRWTIPKSRLTDGPQVRRAFRDAIQSATEATVRIKVDGKDAALGGIVGPDGWIITKASLLGDGAITCRLHDGRELDARVVGVEPSYDLAMLKVDAKRLPSLEWNTDPSPQLGYWVATVGLTKDPLGVGVVATGPRTIAKQAGILGVTRSPEGDGTRIDRVAPGSGADKAGIQVNDQITHVNGVAVKSWEALVREVRKFGPGESIDMTLRRGDKKIEVRATLSQSVQGMRPDRRQMQNSMGGKLSDRRFGFPTAFQHDSVLQPNDCGGPVVDLDGHVLGINIARAGRTESYAIPTSKLMQLMYPLMSGQLLPEEEHLVSAEGAEADTAADSNETKPDAKEPDARKPDAKKPDPETPKSEKPSTEKPNAKKPEGNQSETPKSEPEKPNAKKPDTSRPSAKKKEQPEDSYKDNSAAKPKAPSDLLPPAPEPSR